MCLRANGKLIKERRHALGMTQMQLAVALDMGSVAMLSSWERGAQSISTPNLLKLSKALGVSMEDLLVEKED